MAVRRNVWLLLTCGELRRLEAASADQNWQGPLIGLEGVQRSRDLGTTEMRNGIANVCGALSSDGKAEKLPTHPALMTAANLLPGSDPGPAWGLGQW